MPSPDPPACSAGPSREALVADCDFSPVEAVVREAVDDGLAPGAVVAVTDRPGGVWQCAAGSAGVEQQRPMRIDSVFRIASMTKLVTSIAVLQMVEAGLVALDDPLALHLPGFEQPGVLTSFDQRTSEFSLRPAVRPVTLRDLLTHTSGFGYWFLNREVLLEGGGRPEFFRAPFLMHDPGERFSYGISTDVLGLIVEPVTGLSLPDYFASRIFAPLGLTSTAFAFPDAAERLAAVHVRAEKGFRELPTEPRPEAPRGGGALCSTAGDYLKIAQMLLRGGVADRDRRVLTRHSVELITSNQIGELFAVRQRTALETRTLDFDFLDGTQKFGFNVMVETQPGPDGRPISSYGWGGILNTFFWADPVNGIAAAVMMQVAPFCDGGCLELLGRAERAIYRALR